MSKLDRLRDGAFWPVRNGAEKTGRQRGVDWLPVPRRKLLRH